VARVLVVEDDAWIAWMIADDLADRGYEVSTARDGSEALRCLQTARPDVIVLDLMLPGVTGWDFVERYQQRTGGRLLPIVVVSAAGAVPRSLEQRGVRHVLRKPFDVEQLARSVAEALASTDGPGSATVAAAAPASSAPTASTTRAASWHLEFSPAPDRDAQRIGQRAPLPMRTSRRD
jgi:CheY-like chemotaxis protein